MASNLAFVTLFLLFGSVFCYQGGQLEVTATKVPAGSCEAGLSTSQCVTLDPKCSPNFMTYCSQYFPAAHVHFPNCLPGRGENNEYTEFQTNKDFGDFILPIRSLLSAKNPTPKQTECKNLLLPLICTTLYPMCQNTSRPPRPLFPCYGYCVNALKVCSGVVSLDLLQWNCSAMFRDTCRANPSHSSDGIACMMPSSSPPTCFEECPSDSPPVRSCTGPVPEIKRVKSKITAKTFKNFRFEFGARVKILSKVHLCKPLNAIAYKVKILHDYYLEGGLNCSNNTRQLSDGSTMYIVTEDTVNNCSERCISSRVQVNEVYFMMGTLNESTELTTKCGMKIWMLQCKKLKQTVLYPWSNAQKDKKSGRIPGWVKAYFPSKGHCERNTYADNYY